MTATPIKLERTLNASVERVFDVLTNPKHIPGWYGPSDDFDIKVHEWDCKVGGKYRVEFGTPEGPQIVAGEFKELQDNSKVAYTWAWEGQPPMDTLVTFKISADDNKTRLDFTHEGFPSEEAKGHHEQGWTGSLERLQKSVA